MHKFTPMVETYIQNLKPDQELGDVPVSDSYFIGRLGTRPTRAVEHQLPRS